MKSLFVWSINVINGALSYLTITYLPFAVSASIEVIKTIGLCEWMDHATKHKERSSSKVLTSTTRYLHLRYTAPNTVIKHTIHYLAFGIQNNSPIMLGTLIQRMFLFEVIFDFAHYFLHRACHRNNWLYQNVHKTHHTHSHGLSTVQTMIMSPLELILVYGAPLVFALAFIPMNTLELCIEFSFLSYQEFGGHIGRVMRPTSSFAQFIWLPRLIGSGIELYSEDHEMHHTRLDCNFGKRFSLADKLFGTFYVKENAIKEIESTPKGVHADEDLSPSQLLVNDNQTLLVLVTQRLKDD